jgi:hypothetical protein
MAGIINRAAVDNAYMQKFGRVADDAGADFWMKAAQNDPTLNLNDALGVGAQGADQIAMADINGKGVDITKTWDGTQNANGNLVYDAERNTWSPATTPQAEAVDVATPTPVAAPSVAPMKEAAFKGYGDTSKANWQVDPNTMTVQSQMKNVMDPNSQLMQQAQTQGLEYANGRGLINSSIGQSAVQDSMLKAALPIAQQDAATYAKSASENAGLNTSIANTITGSNTSMYGTDVGSNTQKYGIDTSAATQKYSTDVSAATQKYGIDVSSATQLSTANLQANMQNLLADKNITSGEKIATMQSNTSLMINANNITSGEKIANLQSTTQTTIADKNITSAEKLTGLNNANQLLMSNNQLSMQEKLTGLNNANQLLISTNNLTSSEKIAGLQANTSLAVAAMNKEASMANNAAAITSAQAISQAQQETTRLTTQYQALGQSSSSAASVLVSLNGQIGAVLGNTALSGPAMEAAIAKINTQGANALNVIGSLASNLDLGSFIFDTKSTRAGTETGGTK